MNKPKGTVIGTTITTIAIAKITTSTQAKGIFVKFLGHVARNVELTKRHSIHTATTATVATSATITIITASATTEAKCNNLK